MDVVFAPLQYGGHRAPPRGNAMIKMALCMHHICTGSATLDGVQDAGWLDPLHRFLARQLHSSWRLRSVNKSSDRERVPF